MEVEQFGNVSTHRTSTSNSIIIDSSDTDSVHVHEDEEQSADQNCRLQYDIDSQIDNGSRTMEVGQQPKSIPMDYQWTYYDSDKLVFTWVVKGSFIIKCIQQLIRQDSSAHLQGKSMEICEDFRVNLVLPDQSEITTTLYVNLGAQEITLVFEYLNPFRDMNLSFDVKASASSKELRHITGVRTFSSERNVTTIHESLTNPNVKFPYEYLKNDVLVISGGIRQKVTKWDTDGDIRYIGLRNQGNTCYMNSYLQTLYHLTEFTRLVLKIPSQAQPNKFPDSLQILANGLLQESVPQTTVDLIKSFGWDRSDAFVQQDVQEFGCNLIEALESKVDSHPNLKGEVQRLFQGELKNRLICKHVPFQSIRSETFSDIQLQVKGMKDVIESLRQFTSSELMEGENQYDTGNPKFGKQDTVKSTILSKLPPILQITLKRFGYDYNKNQLVKILDEYEYPEQIDFTEFMDQEARSTQPQMNFQYRLFAVLVHSGMNNGSGHYYVFIHKGGRWYKFNDSQVEIVSWLQVQLSGFGGIANIPKWNERTWKIEQLSSIKKETAYMLVYVQQNKFESITRDLHIDDIPLQILQQYESSKRRIFNEERSKNYQRVQMLSYTNLAKTSGNGLFFQREYLNSIIPVQNLFKLYCNAVEMPSSMTLAELQTYIAQSLPGSPAPTTIVIYKLTLNTHTTIERLANLSRLLNYSSSAPNSLQIRSILNHTESEVVSCLLVLTTNLSYHRISFPQSIETESKTEQRDQQQQSPSFKNQIETVAGRYSENIAVFFKQLHKLEDEEELDENISLEEEIESTKNPLMGYVMVTKDCIIFDALKVYAAVNHLEAKQLSQNYRFYLETEREATLITDAQFKEPIYSVCKNSSYAVIVLERINHTKEEADQQTIVQLYYEFKSKNLSIVFEEHVDSAEYQPKQSLNLLIPYEYTVKQLQNKIKKIFYKNEAIDPRNIYFLCQDSNKNEWTEMKPFKYVCPIMELMQTVRFAYDKHTSLQERQEQAVFEFLLYDQISNPDIVSKPQERHLKVTKDCQYGFVIEQIEDSPTIINNTESSLKGRVVTTRQHLKHPSKLNPIMVDLTTYILEHQDRRKYIHILDREFNEDNDFLIACHFISADTDEFFGYPFLIVEGRSTLLRYFHSKMTDQLKNKKILKAQNLDTTFVLQKFDLHLSAGVKAGIPPKEYRYISEVSTDTLEECVEDIFTERNLLVLQIRVFGINLSSASKKIG